jgi:hypothetical protein
MISIQEIDKAWKMVDAATEREAKARDTIQQLKQEIQNLGKLVNEGAGTPVIIIIMNQHT